MNFPLEGSLRDHLFYQLVKEIVLDKATGVLTIQGETDTVVMVFEFGLCVGAESHYPQEEIRIGQLLCKRGLLTEEKLLHLLDVQNNVFRKFGYLALEENLVNLEQLMDVLEDQMLLIIFPCFIWQHGFFVFRSEENVTYDRETARPIDLMEYAETGDTFLKTWDWIKQQIPDFDAIPRLIPEIRVVPERAEVSEKQLPDNTIMLSALQERVYNYVNGLFTVNEIVQSCHQFPGYSYQALVDLEDLGVVLIPVPEKPKSEMVTKWHSHLQVIQEKLKYLIIPGVAIVLLIFLWLMPFRLFLMFEWQGLETEHKIRTKAKMDQIQFALSTYRLIYNQYPDFSNEFVENGYLSDDDLTDSWGNLVVYTKTAEGYMLSSKGADGEPRTKDDIQTVHLRKEHMDPSFFPGNYTHPESVPELQDSL
ncbi:type II secretion system protein GspG [bacterium]|nr:type II secretion system protein GspG [candidate division CSSED10-310 bacterium]